MRESNFKISLAIGGGIVTSTDLRRGLQSDVGIPLPRREDRHFVQELVDSGQQVLPVASLVRHVVEHLDHYMTGDIACSRVVCVNYSGTSEQGTHAL